MYKETIEKKDEFKCTFFCLECDKDFVCRAKVDYPYIHLKNPDIFDKSKHYPDCWFADMAEENKLEKE